MIRWVVVGVGGFFLLMFCETVGFFVQPWSPWWVTSQPSQTITPGEFNATVPDVPVVAPVVGPIEGAVTDAQRFALALEGGWSREQAIIATAISIAEDGSGNPSALSAPNFDGSRDFGLWQINSGWWPKFGGQSALAISANNAAAAHAIYLLSGSANRTGWCAWSTYEPACGAGHNGAYRAYLGRAQAAAGGN